MFMMLPILDAVNGVLDRQYGKSIGTYYHVLFTAILIAIVGKYVKIEKKHFIWLVLFFVDIALSVTLNHFFGVKTNLIAFDLMMKLICTVLNFECLFILAKKNILESSFFDNVLTITGFIIPIGSLISKLLGIGNTAYIFSEKGFLGFYTSSNELNCILLILCYHSLSHYLHEKKNYYLIAFFLQIVCAVMIESKISVGMCVVAVLILITKLIKQANLKIRKSGMVVILLIIASLFIIHKDLAIGMSSFLERQAALQGIYYKTSGGSIFDYLSSGRGARFDEIFAANYVWDTSVENFFINITRFVIGNGFYNYKLKVYFEMEFFDTFLWMGCIGILLLFMAIYYIVRLSIRKQKDWLACSSTLVAVVCSFFTGHVLCGGVAGIYFAVTCLNTMIYSKGNEKNECLLCDSSLSSNRRNLRLHKIN